MKGKYKGCDIEVGLDSSGFLTFAVFDNGYEVASGFSDSSDSVRDIKDQPTAYDIDGVVGQLKTDSSVKLYGSGNSNNYLIPLKKAIEIVKAGGTCQ